MMTTASERTTNHECLVMPWSALVHHMRRFEIGRYEIRDVDQVRLALGCRRRVNHRCLPCTSRVFADAASTASSSTAPSSGYFSTAGHFAAGSSRFAKRRTPERQPASAAVRDPRNGV